MHWNFRHEWLMKCFWALLFCVSLPAGAVNGGHWVADGDTPLNMIEVEGRWLVSTNSGWHKQYVQSFDEHLHTISARLDLPSVWYGLAYEPVSRVLFASSGANSVYAILFDQGHFGAIREIPLDGCQVTAGLAVQSTTSAWVACNQSERVIRFDPSTGKVLATVLLEGFPYVIQSLPERRIAVTLWGHSSVAILKADRAGPIARVSVGSHPGGMLVLPGYDLLLVACSDADDISWINLKNFRELRRSHIAVSGGALRGAQPNALATDPRTSRIFVALAAANALAVLKLNSGKDPEHNPTVIPLSGGYPTSLLYSTERQTLFVADGRNQVTGPNGIEATASTFPKIGTLIGGGIEGYTARELSRFSNRKSLREQIYGREPTLSNTEKAAIQHFYAARTAPGPLRYVFYILKENRTYDQLFGDIREGNGAPELTLFGSDVTPNHHDLARQFVLFDNFFVDGDVSADGHVWSMAAASTDYVNKFWPSNYSDLAKGVFDGPFDGDADHDNPIAVPGTGFIWDRAKKLGITYRDYGEWALPDPADPNKNVIYLAGLKAHYDPYYRDEIGDVTDQHRTDEWLKEFREFEADGKLPQFTIIHLPNDHTVGTRPGYHTPRAMVADNDLALGRMVEAITQSRFWPQSAIFVLEDDAQDGPDHVDCHRSLLLVISPFVRRHTVEHRRFTTASVLKTIEQILALGSLTYFDDRAPSLLCDFQGQPDLAPFSARQPRVSLVEKNSPDSPGAESSARWDFRKADRAPVEDLNRVIWQSVHGAKSLPPVPIHQIRVSIRV